MPFNQFFLNFYFASLLFLALPCSANLNDPIDYYHRSDASIKLELEKIEKAHLQKGIDKFKQGKFDYAWQEFATILHFVPNHPKALESLGQLSVQIEKPKRAKRYFERALIFSHDHETYGLYAKFLMKQNDIHAAERQLISAIELAPEKAEYYHLLAQIYWEQKEFKLSAHYTQLALKKGLSLQNLAKELTG